MKWLIRILFVLAMFPLMAITCTKDENENCHQHIDMTNNSTADIIVVEYKHIREMPITDATLTLERYKRIKNDDRWSYYIKPGQTSTVFDVLNSSTCLEYYLESADIIFFILDPLIVAESTPEELVDGRAILRKFYYTLDDIKETGDTLIFE